MRSPTDERTDTIIIPNIGARVERRLAGVSHHGTVHYADQLQALVKWDNGRSSSLRLDRDKIRIIDPGPNRISPAKPASHNGRHDDRSDAPPDRRPVAPAPQANLDMLAWFNEDERLECSRCSEWTAVTLPDAIATFCLQCGRTSIDDIPIGLRPELEILAR